MIIRLTSAAAVLGLAGAAPSSSNSPPAPATHIVRLEANRFVPAETRAATGDTIRFVNGDGGPHNVMFLADSIARDARDAIAAAMPKPKLAEISGPLLILHDEAYTIVVPALGAGRYAFVCQPHYANMRGALIVSP